MSSTMSDVMDGLAGLASGAALEPNIYAYPTETVAVPCLLVGYPTKWSPDMTFQNGGTEWSIPVFVVVGVSDTVDSRDALSDVLSGAGAVKAAFDGAHSFGDVRVVDGEIVAMMISALRYDAVRFDCEVYTR